MASSGRRCSTFSVLPEETIDLICRYSRIRRDLVEREEDLIGSNVRMNRASLWSAAVLSEGPPVQKTLLSLRLSSRLLYRIASPLVWETVDVRYLSPKTTDERPCRTHSGVMGFFASHPHICETIHVLSLSFPEWSSFESFMQHDSFRQISSDLERFLRVTIALRIFLISGVQFLSPSSARTLLSLPSLRVFVDSSRYPPAFDFGDFRDMNLDHLDAFGSASMTRYSTFLDCPLKVKCMLIDEGLGRISWPESAKWDWLSTVEELFVSTTREDLISLSAQFLVCNDD